MHFVHLLLLITNFEETSCSTCHWAKNLEKDVKRQWYVSGNKGKRHQ